jgi:hypothetical protein
VTTHRIWIILLVAVVVTTLMLAGSAVAEPDSYSSICLSDPSGQQACDSSSDPNVCIVDGSIVYDKAICDQIAQRAREDAYLRAQEAATQNIAPPVNTPPVTPVTPVA